MSNFFVKQFSEVYEDKVNNQLRELDNKNENLQKLLNKMTKIGKAGS